MAAVRFGTDGYCGGSNRRRWRVGDGRNRVLFRAVQDDQDGDRRKNGGVAEVDESKRGDVLHGA